MNKKIIINIVNYLNFWNYLILFYFVCVRSAKVVTQLVPHVQVQIQTNVPVVRNSLRMNHIVLFPTRWLSKFRPKMYEIFPIGYSWMMLSKSFQSKQANVLLVVPIHLLWRMNYLTNVYFVPQIKVIFDFK